MRAWYENLNARERLVLSIGAGLAAVIVVWGLIWSPLRSNTAALREAVADKSRLVLDLRRAESLGSGGAPAPETDSSRSLVLLVDETARPYGLATTFARTRPNGPNEINVTVQGAPFNVLLTWLIELEQAYAIGVDTAQFAEAREPGLVNGTLSLRRM